MTKAAGAKHRLTSFTAAVLCLLLLVSALLSAGVGTIPVLAAETNGKSAGNNSGVDTQANAAAEMGSVRFVITDNGDSTVTLAFQLKGTSLARTQCAALAFDRRMLTLIPQNVTPHDAENDIAVSAETLLGDFDHDELLQLDPAQFVLTGEGWDTGSISPEYGVSAADGTGILILYAAPQNDASVTYDDYTTVLSVVFRRSADIALQPSSIRLMTYTEQRTFLQSTKLLLSTADTHATFGSLHGGDTLPDASFTGNTAVTGDRGSDSLAESIPWVNRFSDIADNAPYYDAIAYVCRENLFVGSSATSFDPDKPMNRATFAAVLCRLAGAEASVLAAPKPLESPFTDVEVSAWYTPYVLWTAENRIFYGYGDGRFGPEDVITHEQMYLLIQRFTYDWGYNTKDGTNASIASVADHEQISEYAVDGIKFAFANGLLIADADRNIYPQAAAARWELAVLLENLSDMEHTSTDVSTLDTPMLAAILSECPPAEDSMLRGAYQKIYEGLLSLTDRINIASFHLNFEQFKSVYQEAAKQAEFFYVGNTYYYSYSERTGEILSVNPAYTMRGAELVAAQNTYREKLNTILSGVDSSWSDFEKTLYLHDYLATHFIYNENAGQYDVYTFLTTKSGVCQSYTLTMQALLTALGIQNSRVTSYDMNHTWNLVKLGTSWYHMDVTWDDPQPDQLGQVQHTYFLKSDDYMKNNDHKNWTCFDGYTCKDTRYDNAAFTKVHTPIVPSPVSTGVWYYLENETGILWQWDIRAGKRQQLYRTNLKWEVANGIYPSLYTGLICYEDMLLFNSQNDIIAYHLNSGIAETIHSKTVSGSICGLSLSLNEGSSDAVYAVYQVRPTPADKTEMQVRIRLDKLFTYALSGSIRGYFTDAQVKITLLRNGATYKTITTANPGVYLESTHSFTIDGIKPGRYDLLVEKKGCFSYTVKNIDINADTDLSGILGAIPFLSGDINGDGVIGEEDCTLLLAKNTFHRAVEKAFCAAADLNGDGFIDIVDLAILTSSVRFGCKKEDCVIISSQTAASQTAA